MEFPANSTGWDRTNYLNQHPYEAWGIPNPNDQTASSVASGYSFDNALADIEKRARDGDVSAQEKLFNYYSTKKSEETARELTMEREDNQYQRLVEDLRKAGISPYVISSASPGVSAFTGASYSGSNMTTEADNKRTSVTSFGKTLLSLVGTALILALRFL